WAFIGTIFTCLMRKTRPVLSTFKKPSYVEPVRRITWATQRETRKSACHYRLLPSRYSNEGRRNQAVRGWSLQPVTATPTHATISTGLQSEPSRQQDRSLVSMFQTIYRSIPHDVPY